MRKYTIICTLAAAFLAAKSSVAVQRLTIAVQDSNVVLGWPSVEGETYIIQYRPAFDPATPWQTLTTFYPALTGTNWTTFTHTNGVNPPVVCEAGSGAGSNIVPSPFGSSQIADGSLPADSGSALPPSPWDSSTWSSGSESLSPSNATFDTPSGDTPTCVDSVGMGFYRVVKDGVRITDSALAVLTNGPLSGTVNVGFEAAYADPSNGTNVLGTLDSAVLIVDGVQFPGDGVLSAPDDGSPWQFTMDTAFLENGYHSISLEVIWQNPDSTDNQNPTFTRYSDSVSVTVSNTIYYPQWEPEIGELDISAYFAKTTCTNANWSIDIYDASSNLVNTLTGYTTDGTITAYWNLTDTNGIVRTNVDADPYFDSVITVGDPVSKTAPRKNQRRKDWPGHGVWTIAYQDFFKFEYDDGGYMQGSINNFAYTAQKYGGYYLYYPQPGQTNDVGQTYPIRFQKTNHYDPTITSAAIAKDHAMFLAMLSSTNSRNLYLSSHGSASTVAGGFPASDVQKHVKHRYRFVFLDGCETANGNWDKAFGINGPGRFDISYYQRTGIRPAAFCGYNRQTSYATGGPVDHDGVHYDDTIG